MAKNQVIKRTTIPILPIIIVVAVVGFLAKDLIEGHYKTKLEIKRLEMAEKNKTASEISKEIFELNKELEEALQKLPQWGNGCNCGTEESEFDESDEMKLIFEGQWDEIHTTCVNCGGYTEE
jgi:hypothetical protein